MMVLASSGTGIRNQVFPIDYETEVSQRLIDAAHDGNTDGALECIANPFVDVNFIGTVSLKCRTTEIVLHDESPHEVRFGYEEFKTEVTALFLAAHTGNLILLRKLLNVGGNVNERLFRGYSTTAAVREGHRQVLEILIDAGADQPACEEALMEASLVDRPRFADLLMESNMIRPHVAVHALVSASCRGFSQLVHVLLKHGVDANAIDRTLLQSSKPFLHANVHCNALFAAVVSRHIHVVRLLLQVGIRTDIEAKLGAWTWEIDTGEEFRVGAGLADAYPITWCAVEYFEASGTILSMLLQHLSPNTLHFGRTLLHHAILCNNQKAVNLILNSGANTELAVKSTKEANLLYPIHLAARLGSCGVLRCLHDAGCNLDSQTQSGDTGLVISTRHKHEDCFKVLVSVGADLGLVNSSGETVMSIAKSGKWTNIFQKAILDVIRGGNVVKSSNASVFSALILATRADDVEALKELIGHRNISLDEQDENGFSAAMIAVAEGKTEAFRLLLKAGADVLKLRNRHNLTALDLININKSAGKIFEKIMLEFALEKGSNVFNLAILNPLHHAARHGDTNLVHKLIKKGFDVNTFDNEGYTPLMLAARESQSEMCKLLISCGAKCDIQNEITHETTLSLSRGNGAERVIFDELARRLVLRGDRVKKHTKRGKGSPHSKELRMVEGMGTLRWGKSKRRNVVCKVAEIGASDKFRWNRRRKYDVEEPGLFHVVTTKNKEFHFMCSGGGEMAQLWVRGIKLATREAIFG